MDKKVSISNRAKQCILLFSQCPEPIADAWAEDQSTKFKIWASNLGVFALGHASIDYQLGPLGCHNRKSYRLISQLLDAIFENLRIVSQLARAPEASHYLDLEDTTTQDDRSSSASSDIDDDPEESTPAQRLRHGCIEVEDLISRLNAITATVRRAGARYREEKALGFEDIVELEAKETKDTPETRTEGEPKSNIEFNITEQFATMIAARIDGMFPDAKTWFRMRVANAIAMRRNYLAYLDRQQQRLTQFQDGDSDSDDAFSEELSAESSDSEYAASDSGPSMQRQAERMMPSQAVSVGRRSGVSTISFNWRTGDLKIPRPERIFEDVFQCPYCHIFCDVKESQGDRWIKHVMTDLYPYICLFSDCETPSVAYPTSHEWVFHMKQAHMPRKWVCCSDSQHDETFSDEEEYVDHVRTVHDPWLSRSQLAALAQANYRPTGSLFKVCPFGCKAEDIEGLSPKNANRNSAGTEEPSSKNANGSGAGIEKILIKHIGRHLQYLATLPLPWLAKRPGLEVMDSDEEHSDEDALIDEPEETGFDKDWKTIPENSEPTNDPTWESWAFEHPNEKLSREREWSLKQGDTTLLIYSGAVYDPIVLEFRLAFDKLPEEKRENLFLEPPSLEDLVSQPKLDLAFLPTTFLDPGDSDDGNEIIQMRINETSERFAGAVESLKTDVKTQVPRSEQKPPKESTPTLNTGTLDEIKKMELDSPNIGSVREKHDTVAESISQSTALPKALAASIVPIIVDNKFKFLDTHDYSRHPASERTPYFKETAVDDGKVLEKCTAEFVALLESQIEMTPGRVIRCLWPLERNTSQSVLKTIEEMQLQYTKYTKGGREFGQLQRSLGKLLNGNSLRAWEVLTSSHVFLSAFYAGLEVILRILQTNKMFQGAIFDLFLAISEALTLDNLQHSQESAWKVVLARHCVSLWTTVFSMMTAIIKERHYVMISRLLRLSRLPELLKEKSEYLRELKQELDLDIREATRKVLLDDLREIKVAMNTADPIIAKQRSNAEYLNEVYRYFLTQSTSNDRNPQGSMLEILTQGLKSRSENVNLPQPNSISLAEALAYLSCEAELDAPKEDLEAIRKVSARLSQKDQDRFSWVFSSIKFSSWLEVNEPSFLVINGRLPSIQRRTFLSSVCAELAQQLSQGKSKRLVLSSFVGEHIRASPAWVLRSMLATALKWWGKLHPKILEDIKRRDLTKARKLTKIFSKLIGELPKETVVVFLIDGISFYADTSRQKETIVLLKFLRRLCRSDTTRFSIVKVLLTVPGHMPLRTSRAGLSEKKEVLVVPDGVPPAPLRSSGRSKRFT